MVIPIVVPLAVWFVTLSIAWLIHGGIRSLRHGTTLQKGLSRLWIACSAAWIVRSVWWLSTSCSSVFDGYNCTSGTFRVEHAHLSNAAAASYVLITPIALLLTTLAAYWVIRGFCRVSPSS